MAKNDQGLLSQLCAVFNGPLKGWTYFALVIGLLFTIAFFYSGWRFWVAESVNDHLHWGVATLLFALFVAMLKIWFWLQMAQAAIIRELKK